MDGVFEEVFRGMEVMDAALLHAIAAGSSLADTRYVIRSLTGLERTDLFAPALALHAAVDPRDFERIWDAGRVHVLQCLVDACRVCGTDKASAALQEATAAFQTSWLPRQLHGAAVEAVLRDLADCMGVPFPWSAVPCSGECGSQIWRTGEHHCSGPEDDELCATCAGGDMTITVRCFFGDPFSLTVNRHWTVKDLAMSLLAERRCNVTTFPTLDTVVRRCALGTNIQVVGPCGLEHEDNWCRGDVSQTLRDKKLVSGATVHWRFAFLL